MADSGLSSSSSSDVHSRNSPRASLLDEQGEATIAVDSEAGLKSPQSLGSQTARSATNSQTSPSVSTIAAPGAWHQNAADPDEPLPPSPTESQYTPGPNPFVDLVVGASAQAYRTLGFDSASSLSGSTPSPGPRWERESEYAVTVEETVHPDPNARRLGGLSERQREKARAVDSDMDPLPVSPPHRRSGSTLRTPAREEEDLTADRTKAPEEKVKRRRRRVHHYYYYPTDDRYQEYGFSRDFFLIVWLCLGIACFLILVGRSVRVNAGALDFEALL